MPNIKKQGHTEMGSNKELKTITDENYKEPKDLGNLNEPLQE